MFSPWIQAEGAQRRFERLRVVAEAVRRERAALYVGQYLAPDLGERRCVGHVLVGYAVYFDGLLLEEADALRRLHEVFGAFYDAPALYDAEPYLAYRALAVVGAFKIYRREGEFVAFRQVVGGFDYHARASEPGRLSARYGRVTDFSQESMSRGSPAKIISPPEFPPPGPSSTM